jgi:hypothetical protein
MYAAGAAVTRPCIRVRPERRRSCRAAKSNRPARHTTSSPSRTTSSPGDRGGNVGNPAVRSRSWRDCRCTPLRSRKASALNPSNVGSYDQPAPVGSCPTVFAAIGGSGGRSGAVTAGLYAGHGGLTGSGRSAARETTYNGGISRDGNG